MRTSSKISGLRPVRFEDVSAVLGLIHAAVEHGCRDYYDRAQRAAVFASYAHSLFIDVLGPFETVAVEANGRLVAFAQVDPESDRLRALFVEAELQHRGLGRALLEEIERRAIGRGARRLHGAMSLNAIPFYLRAGFRPCGGAERLIAAGVSVPVLRMEKGLEPNG
jgi:GNAT superfamily N-acetyltransferase